MKTSFNLSVVKNYAKQLTQVILNDAFSNKTELTPQDLKTLTRIEQVNMFVIQALFLDWKKEEEKNVNPYYNHNHPDVITAKKRYLNVLSAHISLTKEEAQSFVEQAIIDCLFLLFFPYDYYGHLLEKIHEEKNEITLDYWKLNIKYIRINTELKERITFFLEENKEKKTTVQPIDLLNQACEKLTSKPISIEPIFEKFQAIVDAQLNDFIENISEGNERNESEENENGENENGENEKEGSNQDDIAFNPYEELSANLSDETDLPLFATKKKGGSRKSRNNSRRKFGR